MSMVFKMRLKDGDVTVEIGKGIGNTLEKELRGAKRRLWAISPWVTEEYAGLLVRKSENGVDVRLTIKDRLTDFVHGKVYVVDSRAMIGSANLTNAGMKRNSEALVVFDKASIVDGIARIYEELEG